MNNYKSGPFKNQTKIDHSKSGHVQISDPHCSLVFRSQLYLDCDCITWKKTCLIFINFCRLKIFKFFDKLFDTHRVFKFVRIERVEIFQLSKSLEPKLHVLFILKRLFRFFRVLIFVDGVMVARRSGEKKMLFNETFVTQIHFSKMSTKH